MTIQKNNKLQLGPFEVEAISPEDAEEVDAVVCVRAGEESEHFKVDNVYTTCAYCGTAITHRPTAPKKPRKLCILCAMKDAELHNTEPGGTVH